MSCLFCVFGLTCVNALGKRMFILDIPGFADCIIFFKLSLVCLSMIRISLIAECLRRSNVAILICFLRKFVMMN
jgi:hypothetical protein